jgi:antitoxin component YwqK of YwqJK toxin-antitoxin module
MEKQKRTLNMVNGIAMLEGKPFTGNGKAKRGFKKDEIENHKEKLDALSPEIKLGKISRKLDLTKGLEKHQIEYSYVDGKLHGMNRKYYPSGHKRVECNYNCGLPDGIEKTWEENGNLNKETEYKNGKMDGVEKIYKDGILTTEMIWEKDEMIQLKAFYEDGRLNMFEVYKNGEIIESEFY